MLTGVKMDMLRYTIPGFHDLNWRWQQFQDALATGDSARIALAKTEIEYLQSRFDIVEQFNAIKKDPDFKIRVTHHDTKISNVLLDENEKGICVIDLDTVMPGYFISDLGDMFRTYLSPANEEERDLSKITVRKDFYDAIVKGYLTFMEPELTATEKAHFHYAGEFMIYMQALRFLTDYLNNDRYYGQSYEGHNLLRAQNQIALLSAFVS
jgi:thiamine kinase-like enzyme